MWQWMHLPIDCQRVLLYTGYAVGCLSKHKCIHIWPARKVPAETADTANVCDVCSGIATLITNLKHWTGQRVRFPLLSHYIFSLEAGQIWSEPKHHFKIFAWTRAGGLCWAGLRYLASYCHHITDTDPLSHVEVHKHYIAVAAAISQTCNDGNHVTLRAAHSKINIEAKKR